MTTQTPYVARYTLKSAEQTSKRVAQRVADVISDKTVKSTEVIRDGRFVHGRVSPVAKAGTR